MLNSAGLVAMRRLEVNIIMEAIRFQRKETTEEARPNKSKHSSSIIGPALPIQTKLTINTPGDQYEQEADRVAEQVMRMPDPASRSSIGPCEPNPTPQLQRRATAVETPSPVAAPSLVHDTLRSPGQALDSSTRAFFETRFNQDFSHVRVHTDNQAATSAGQISAQAYTVGRDIVFGSGQYAPSTAKGRQLLAHELAHVVQQHGSGNRLQRSIDAAALPRTPVSQIMADETYFENGISRIEFFSAELAIIHYEDGATIRLGLVPDLIESPFEAVDYRTARSEHLPITQGQGLGTGSIRFIPRVRQIQAPPGTSIAEIERAVGRTINFRIHPGSGRIVPTEVNSVSAPRLTAALRQAEAEYVSAMDEMARGMVRTLQIMEWVIILGSLLTAGLAAAGARRAAVSGAAAVLSRAQSQLLRFFLRLLRSGAAESITVEGVQLSTVRVTMRGTQLWVQRFSIENVARIPGRGRLIQSAVEQAAIQAGREAGAQSAHVAVEMVVNPAWRAYLESLGYAKTLVPYQGGVQALWTRVFTL